MTTGFSNPIVGGSGDLVYPQIRSPGFVSGVTGWRIGKDGTLEANNGIFRGTVEASDFAAVIQVAAGPFAGTYNVLTIPFTDSAGNQVAVVTWFNTTNSPLVSPYVAGVSGPGAGAIANVQSGQQDGADSGAALWLESKEASGLGGPLALLDTEFFQPFGGAGITLAMAANGAFGMVADSWHAPAGGLGTGWSAGGGIGGVFAMLLDNGNVFLAWDVTTATSSNPNNICTLPYAPATTVQLQSGHASGAPAAYTAAFAPSVKVQGSGAFIGQGIPSLSGTIELFGTAIVPMGTL